MLIDSEQKSQP